MRLPNLDVERWFAGRKLPSEKVMRRVRDIILAADPRITDAVRNRTVQFQSGKTLAGFVELARPTVTLKFGAGISGRYPHLEGSGPGARFMRFADLKEVEARAPELRRIVAAWCKVQQR
jgi:hypothetical protein